MRGVVSAYLIIGKETALVDTGYRSSAANVIQDLLGHRIDDLDYLLPTHVHLGHTGACGTLAGRFDMAAVLAHPKGTTHLCDPSRLIEATTELFGVDLMRDYGAPEPVAQARVRSVSDGEEIALGSGVTLRAIWTPGHASHHLSYFVEESGDLLTGDAVGIKLHEFPILLPTTPPTSFNLKLALESLERIRKLAPSRFLTPHFGVIGNVKEAIDDNIRSLAEWKTDIESMMAKGDSVDDIAEIMVRRMCSLAGKPPESIPRHLRVSMRLSVLGLVRYMKKL